MGRIGTTEKDLRRVEALVRMKCQALNVVTSPSFCTTAKGKVYAFAEAAYFVGKLGVCSIHSAV